MRTLQKLKVSLTNNSVCAMKIGYHCIRLALPSIQLATMGGQNHAIIVSWLINYWINKRGVSFWCGKQHSEVLLGPICGWVELWGNPQSPTHKRAFECSDGLVECEKLVDWVEMFVGLLKQTAMEDDRVVSIVPGSRFFHSGSLSVRRNALGT